VKRILIAVLALTSLGGGTFLALTSFASGPAVAHWAPCPRNWAWIPAWLPRVSPLRDLRFAAGDGTVRVCYGAPALRGRTMLGGAAVPFGHLWRTGANEPTTLHSDVSLRLGDAAHGGLVLAPGSYALYTVPGPERWEIIVNRSIRQWGIESEYSPEVASQELGRFTVDASALSSPVEQMRFTAEPSPSGLALVLSWQTTRLAIPLSTVEP